MCMLKGEDSMRGNLVITIGRQCGSGGKMIGQKIAEKLGVKCYDKELLTRAAKESGLCEELFETHDEKPTSSFLYSLVMDTYSLGYTTSAYMDMPINHKIFLAQFDTIKKLADQESCVIVGRCADYALADYPETVSVFICADEADKIERIKELHNVNDAKARDINWIRSVPVIIIIMQANAGVIPEAMICVSTVVLLALMEQ